MKKDITAAFAVPYVQDFDVSDEIFFIKFKTKDENEARLLSRCICGSDTAVIILDKNGFVW